MGNIGIQPRTPREQWKEPIVLQYCYEQLCDFAELGVSCIKATNGDFAVFSGAIEGRGPDICSAIIDFQHKAKEEGLI